MQAFDGKILDANKTETGSGGGECSFALKPTRHREIHFPEDKKHFRLQPQQFVFYLLLLSTPQSISLTELAENEKYVDWMLLVLVKVMRERYGTEEKGYSGHIKRTGQGKRYDCKNKPDGKKTCAIRMGRMLHDLRENNRPQKDQNCLEQSRPDRLDRCWRFATYFLTIYPFYSHWSLFLPIHKPACSFAPSLAGSPQHVLNLSLKTVKRTSFSGLYHIVKLKLLL